MFRTVPLSTTRSFSLYTQQWYTYMSYRLDCLLASRIRMEPQFHPDPTCKLSANLHDIYRCCVYSETLLVMDRGTVRNIHLYIHTYIQQDQDGTADSSWSCSQAVCKTVWLIPLLCVQWKTRDDGQSNCPKHVDFYSKNKFEKSVHLVGFIERTYHDARSHKRQKAKHIYLLTLPLFW
jgi:hypothetical protein